MCCFTTTPLHALGLSYRSEKQSIFSVSRPSASRLLTWSLLSERRDTAGVNQLVCGAESQGTLWWSIISTTEAVTDQGSIALGTAE